MVELFVALQTHHGNSGSASISSEEMQQRLRMCGLFNFTSPSSDPVSGFDTVTLPIMYIYLKHTYHTCVHT